MPFLTLNGVTVPVAECKPKREPVGSLWRAFSGKARNGIQKYLRSWDCRTGPLPLDEARALRGLVNGAGRSWSFDLTYWSADGKAYVSQSNTTFAGGGKHGSLLRLGATTGVIYLPIGHAAPYTAMLFRLESSVWNHYLVKSSGPKWVNGVRNDAAVTSWLTFSSNTVVLTNTGGAAQDYDDLVVLPYEVPNSWASELYTWHNLSPFTVPRLVARGDFDDEGVTGLAVEGEVTEVDVMRAAGGPRAEVNFILREVV